MSSLFDDLPSPSKAKESTTPTCVPAKAAAVDAKPALKKRREEKGGGGAGEDAKRQRKGAVRFGDEAGLTGVTASDALKRIEKHIGQPTKCYKSCQLVLKLIQGGQLSAQTSGAFFKVLQCAMRDLGLSAEPQLRRIFRKLFLVCEANLTHFSSDQQLWIKEYSLLAIVRNELYTDDSFLFNKRIAFVRKEFQELLRKHDPSGLPSSSTAECDTTAGAAAALRALHLEALVSCLETAKSVYRPHAWSRSGTDLLVQAAYDCIKCLQVHKPDLTERILQVVRFVDQEKNLRKRNENRNRNGESTKDHQRKEETKSSFDAAVETWKGKEGISKRSSQGGGDSWRNASFSFLG